MVQPFVAGRSRNQCARFANRFKKRNSWRVRSEPLEPRVLLAAAPALVGAGVSYQQIHLQWTGTDPSAADLVLERSQGDNPFAQVATLSPGMTSYEDGNLSPVSTFQYRLREDLSAGPVYSNVITASTLPAQTTTLVEALPPALVEGSSDPEFFVASHGFALFTIRDPSGSGLDLWRTDGTTAGTFSLNTSAPGHSNSFDSVMVDLAGTVYYARGNQLWKSDGTVAGTTMVTSVFPGQTSSEIIGLVSFRNVLYLIANGNQQSALWTSDGTAAGTKMVQLLPQGNGGIDSLTVSGGKMFFISFVQTPTALVRHLWASDGTSSGTAMLNVPDARELYATDGRLYFNGYDSANNFALWSTDGTDPGTVELSTNAAINQGEIGLQPGYLGQDLYFLAPTN